MDSIAALPTVPELAEFVHRTLCEFDALDPGLAPLRQTLLTRAGRPCGLVFHVDGPRLLRTSAVWSAEDRRVLFYNSTGERVRTVMLSVAPELMAMTESGAKAAA